MKIQTICKDQHKDACCHQNINLVFPDGVGLISGVASTVDLNSNIGDHCRKQEHPIYDATLFAPQEAQFGLHIRNKLNKWNFAQIANPDSISLSFELAESKRELKLYDDRITIYDGEIESSIVTLSDLLTMGLVDENGNINASSNTQEVNNLKARVGELEEQVEKLKLSNVAMTKRVIELEVKVEKLESKVEEFEEYVEDLNLQYSTLLKNLQQQIDDIKAQLEQ